MSTLEIVPPEPYSKGPDLRKTWAQLPRWLQFGLVLLFVVAGVLILVFLK